jgi:hypothetical protein
MRKRRWLVILGIALALGLVGWILLTPRTPYPVTVYERVHLGMTVTEAEGALGMTANSVVSPFDPFFRERFWVETFARRGQHLASDGRAAMRKWAVWQWDDYWICADLDESDRIVYVRLLGACTRLYRPTCWQLLRALFHL